MNIQEQIADAVELDYRRANNIYEVGDAVVYLDDFMDSKLMTISKIDGVEAWMNDWRRWCYDFKSMIRHATDAEIKAGHRL